MKQILSILATAALLSSCGGSDQAKAIEQEKQALSILKENTPGTIHVKDGGYTMTAKLDGKDWTAGSMMPQEIAGRIIGYNNGEYIGLPYDRRYLVPGKKIKFGEGNAVDLSTHDDIGIWGSRKGEMEITKVDENMAEGRFFFTASSSRTNKTIEVTEGFFRILFPKK